MTARLPDCCQRRRNTTDDSLTQVSQETNKNREGGEKKKKADETDWNKKKNNNNNKRKRAAPSDRECSGSMRVSPVEQWCDNPAADVWKETLISHPCHLGWKCARARLAIRTDRVRHVQAHPEN